MEFQSSFAIGIRILKINLALRRKLKHRRTIYRTYTHFRLTVSNEWKKKKNTVHSVEELSAVKEKYNED